MAGRVGLSALCGLLAACLALAAGAAQAQAQAPTDSLKVTFCGTSGPLPIRDRAKSCLAVQAGDALYLVDIGPEATKNLQLWRMPIAKVKAVFITHLHSDHIGDLGEFNMQSWVAGRPGPLLVVGPQGTNRLVEGFNEAYSADHDFRHAHHEHGIVKLPIDIGLMEAKVVTLPSQADARGVISKVVFVQGGLTVTAIAVNHFPVVPAFAYRFDYKGRSVVVSGDTRKWPPLATAAKGADVLIHEAQNDNMTKMLAGFLAGNDQARLASIMTDTLSYHTTPIEAAEIARDAGVKALVLTHITQAGLPFYTPEAFTRGMDKVGFANWRLADDGLTIDLPVGSDAINYGHR
jgi:ribonuclease Z